MGIVIGIVIVLAIAAFFAVLTCKGKHSDLFKWLLIAISYQCIFAYIVSFIIYQVGSLVIGQGSIIGGVLGILCLAIMIYLIVRKPSSVN